MRYAIMGLIGSGKNTVSQYMQQQSNMVSFAFADRLKDVLAVAFGWDRQLLEGVTTESREWRDKPDPYWSRVLKREFTPRMALTEWGTDLIRNHFCDTFWVNILGVDIEKLPVETNIIVTDCRNRNELEYVKSLGFVFIEVMGNNQPQWYYDIMNIRQQDKYNCDELETDKKIEMFMKQNYPTIHSSEYAWVGVVEPEIKIDNTGSLIDLYNQVDAKVPL